MSGPRKFVVNEFDKDSALFFAKLSGAAYYTPKAFVHFLRKESIENDYKYEFIDHNSSQAYVLWDDENFIIAFRGTQPSEMEDVIADMKFWKKPAWEGGKVHTGFATYVDEIWDQIKQLFFKHGVRPNGKTKRVYTTGHSLGAAAATIAASRLGTFARGCFTFGSPRSGNRKFINTIKCPVWRFRNQRDLVTRIPLALMGFKHVGKFCYIDGNHELRIGAVKFVRLFKDAVASVFNKVVADGFVDHSMSDYIKYINECDTVHKKVK